MREHALMYWTIHLTARLYCVNTFVSDCQFSFLGLTIGTILFYNWEDWVLFRSHHRTLMIHLQLRSSLGSLGLCKEVVSSKACAISAEGSFYSSDSRCSTNFTATCFFPSLPSKSPKHKFVEYPDLLVILALSAVVFVYCRLQCIYIFGCSAS